MYTYVLKRNNEEILISEYGFEWYVDNKLQRSGLVENLKNDLAALKEEGFAEA